MARATFGGTAGDFLSVSGPGGVVRTVSGVMTVWSAKTGGTQYTDLLLNGSPVSSIPVGRDGQVPEFQGPDGVGEVWGDAGAGRVRLVSDKSSEALASDTFIAEQVNDDDSETAAALAGKIAASATGIVGDEFTARAGIDYVTPLQLSNSISPANSAPRIPASPVVKMIPACVAGHSWTLSGANLNGGASNLNSTEQVMLGSQSVKVVSNLGGANSNATTTGNFSAFNATDCDIRVWVYFPAGSQPNLINMALVSAGFASSTATIYTLGGGSADLSGSSVQPGRWNVIDVPLAAFGSGVDVSAITSMQFSVTDNGVAPAVVYVGGAAFVKKTFTNLFQTGVISITADDSEGTQWSILKPALDARGYKATFFPIVSQLNGPGALTTAQLHSLYDQGHEIGAHASTGAVHAIGHQNMSPAQRAAEYATLRAWMAAEGFYSPSFAWPLGSHDYDSELDVAKFYSVARTATYAHLQPQYIAAPYARQAINAGTQFSLLSTQLTKAATAKSWTVICLHAIKASGDPTRTGNDITPAQLTTLLDNIAASGCAVMPMGDVVRALAA